MHAHERVHVCVCVCVCACVRARVCVKPQIDMNSATHRKESYNGGHCIRNTKYGNTAMKCQVKAQVQRLKNL
jgi:hypothetical protein